MKQLFNSSSVILLLTGLFYFVSSCNNGPAEVSIPSSEIISVRQSGAVFKGIIKAKGKNSVTSRGVCWSPGTEPSIKDKIVSGGKGTGDYFCTIDGLKPAATYYARAYALSTTDTIYGNIITFTTQDYGSVTDSEGNEYKTITIGTQTWMVKNLAATKYNDGTSIPLVADSSKWASLSSHGYCFYNNDPEAYKASFGVLYNGYTVNSGKICPSGWHVPSNEEWDVLAAYLGGNNVAGGRMKEAGTSHWVRPNSGASNTGNFSALPGGLRYHDGHFHDLGFGGYWWSSTQYSATRGYFIFLFHEDSTFYRFDNLKTNGFSIRCLKNN